MANAISGEPTLNGLVLTGGRSHRMGQDKSRLVYHDKPQRDHLTELLKPFCQTVYWSVNAGQADELTGSGQPVIIDAFDLRSPLNGILSAFEQNDASAWLVVACDMPLLTTRSLTALTLGRDTTCLATVFYDSDGRLPEPLLGIYEPAFAPVARQAITQGEVSPRRILRVNPIRLLTAPDTRELTNVNDPQAQAALGFRNIHRG